MQVKIFSANLYKQQEQEEMERELNTFLGELTPEDLIEVLFFQDAASLGQCSGTVCLTAVVKYEKR